jgi:hypothetical protein
MLASLKLRLTIGSVEQITIGAAASTDFQETLDWGFGRLVRSYCSGLVAEDAELGRTGSHAQA